MVRRLPVGVLIGIAEARHLERPALGFIRNLEIGLLGPQTALDVGRRVNRREADAVMLACGNWSMLQNVDLEHMPGVNHFNIEEPAFLESTD